jgi:hypothetical protein
MQIRKQHRTINVGEIATHLDRFTEATPDPKGTPIPVDLTTRGYHKVLGGGSVPFALKVTAPLFTRRAAEKIKSAGGKIKGDVLPGPEKTAKPKAKTTTSKPKAKTTTSKPKAKTTTSKPKAKPKTKRKSS